MEQPNTMQPGQAPGPGGMQRPQPGNPMQQIHAQIMQSLRNTMHQLPQGWQTTYDPRDRAGRVMQMVTQLRFLQPDVTKCLNTALTYEMKMISEAHDRQHYISLISTKLEEIANKRHSMAPANMQNPQMGGLPMNPNMGMMPNGLPNMSNMQNGLGNNPMNGLNNMMAGMQANGQGFPAQLQRQMQPSLPRQPTTLDPSALLQQNQPQPQQRPQMNPQMTQAMNQGQQGVQQGPTHEEILRLAQGLYARAPEERKMGMRNQILQNMTPEMREQTKAEGVDPLMKIFYQRAREMATGQQRNGGGPQNGAQNAIGQQNMQNSQPDFTSILGQQANGLKSQESGNEVVPASNNVNFGLGGQMNVPQGMNPQMLAGQGNQPGGNAAQMNPQMQFMMQQQERQQRMQRNNLLAQQQAQAQSQHANQLRGQPGGLNAPNALTGGPPGQLNSPAMPTLNRPMGPTGQANSNAAQQAQNAPQANQKQPQPGQQNRPQGPLGNMNQGPNQLSQQQQQVLNQSNPQMNNNMPNPQQHQQLMQFIQTLPQELQQKLNSLPPQQAQMAIARLRAQAQAKGIVPQRQGNVPNNMNMPQNGQQQMLGGMQQNNANAGLGAQPPQGQPNQAFDPQKQAQSQHQQAMIRQRAMDFAPFPKQILQQIGVNTTQTINVWGELKKHVQQNQSILPQGTFDRVIQAQHQYFETHPDELPRAMQALRTRMQQANAQGQQPGVLNALQQMSMQNGGAPQMQNMPQNPGMQMANGGAPGMGPAMPRLPPNLAPTQQEIQAFRERNSQLTQNMTDDHLRAMLTKKKLDTLRSQQAQQLYQQNVLRNAQQMQQNQAQPQRPPQQPGPPQMGGQAVQQPRPQGAANQPAPVHGQKRPQSSHDDVVEIPNPNVSRPPAAAPVPAGQATQTKPPGPSGLPKGFPTKEQLAKMPPQAREAVIAQMRQAQQQQQREALRKAQSGLPNNAAQGASPYLRMPEHELRQKIQQLMKETYESVPKGPRLQLDEQSTLQVKAGLRKLFGPLQRVSETFGHGLRMSAQGESMVRAVIRVKSMVMHNIANVDEEGNVIVKGYLSVNPAEVMQFQNILTTYFNELKVYKEGPTASTQPPPSRPAAAPAAPPAATGKRASTSSKSQAAPAAQAASMSKTASQQGHARKASSSKAPPAPTDNKSFDWGVSAPSPHGVPQYNPQASELTPDKLKMPPQKRAKKGQADSQTNTPSAQAGTPNAPAASPKLAKPPSPQQQRKAAQQLKEQTAQKEAESHKFRCKEFLCEGSIAGFETEAELQNHVDSMHHQTIDDALAFLLANEPVEAKTAPTKESKAPVAATRKALVKERPLSAIKVERTGTGSPAMSAAAKGSAAAPTADGIVDAPGATPTLREAMAAKLGFELPKLTEHDMAAPVTDTNGEDAFIAMLENAAFGTLDAVDDLADFTSIDDYWTLRPDQTESSPSLTPSDGTTSQSSDISQTERLRINLEWDPWGTGDTVVPAGLQDLESLGLGSETQVTDGDATMADASDDSNKEGADASNKVDDKMWDWNADTHASDWDILFGPNAGLEPGEQDWSKDWFTSYG